MTNVIKTFKQIAFWFLQFTWGLPTTLIGCFYVLYALVIKAKCFKFGYTYCFILNKMYSGVSLGAFYFLGPVYENNLFINQHETGHQFQNIMFGLFFPFIVGLPSAIRHHLHRRKNRNKLLKVVLIIYLLLVFLSFIFLIPGVLLNILWLKILGIVFFLYGTGILLWMILSEVPKIKNNTFDYYGIWFESTASSIGKKIYEKNCGILKYPKVKYYEKKQ